MERNHPRISTNRRKAWSRQPGSPLLEPSQLRIHLLGELLLEYDQEPLLTATWSKYKPLALLEILLTFRHTLVPKDRLIEWLWPHLQVDSAANSLRVSIRTLRQALRPPHDSKLKMEYIRTRHQGYCFDASEAWVDVDEFQSEYKEGIRAAGSGEVDRAQAHLEAGIALYRGDYLQNAPYEEWARPERQRVRSLYLSALGGLAGIHALSGRYENAILLCEHILSVDQCHEVTYSQLMRCQYAAGDRVGAVRTYEKCRERLNEELGLSPMPETERLYKQIVDDEMEPSLDFALNPLPTLAEP